MTRRIVRSPNPFRKGATFHRDPSPGEMESVEMAFPSTGTHRELLDELMRQHDGGLDMFEAAALLGWPGRNNVNPRMQELKREGLVYKTGETRPTGEGGRADVWRHTCFLTADVPTPRSTPAPRSKAGDAPTSKKSTRGASSTGSGPTTEQTRRALERTRANRAAAASSTS